MNYKQIKNITQALLVIYFKGGIDVKRQIQGV
jgi:hypothetical protein